MTLRLREAALALLWLVKLRRRLWKRYYLESRDALVSPDPVTQQAQMERYCYLKAIAPSGMEHLLPSPDSDDSDVGGY